MTPIMLVTADKEMVRWAKAALRDSTAKIAVECSTVKAAVDELAKNQVAMVVLDLFLPGSSGIELLKSLKRVNENCVTLLLSRMRTRLLLERAFRQGAQDVLLYPVSAEIFRDTILHRLATEPLVEADASAEAQQKPARGKK